MYSYYIVYLSDNEYLFDYNIAEKHINVTGMDIEAKQFDSKHQAEHVAEFFGGHVKEVKHS